MRSKLFLLFPHTLGWEVTAHWNTFLYFKWTPDFPLWSSSHCQLAVIKLLMEAVSQGRGQKTRQMSHLVTAVTQPPSGQVTVRLPVTEIHQWTIQVALVSCCLYSILKSFTVFLPKAPCIIELPCRTNTLVHERSLAVLTCCWYSKTLVCLSGSTGSPVNTELFKAGDKCVNTRWALQHRLHINCKCKRLLLFRSRGSRWHETLKPET